jgi:hypothetical protein
VRTGTDRSVRETLLRSASLKVLRDAARKSDFYKTGVGALRSVRSRNYSHLSWGRRRWLNPHERDVAGALPSRAHEPRHLCAETSGRYCQAPLSEALRATIRNRSGLWQGCWARVSFGDQSAGLMRAFGWGTQHSVSIPAHRGDDIQRDRYVTPKRDRDRAASSISRASSCNACWSTPPSPRCRSDATPEFEFPGVPFRQST